MTADPVEFREPQRQGSEQCFVGADPDEIDEINRGVVFSPCAGAADHDGEIGSAERSTGRFYRPPIAAGAWPQTVSRQRYTPS